MQKDKKMAVDVKSGMKKHLRFFLAGVLVVAPLAFTFYVVWTIGAGLDGFFRRFFPPDSAIRNAWIPGTGAVAALMLVYLVGLLTQVYVFRIFLDVLERGLVRVPVVKTIYESVRDILKLFGGDSKRMGQVVRYHVPNTNAFLLGIRTSTTPRVADDERVAVYLPMSYQLGGFTVYVPPSAVEPLDMNVEEALKIAATAAAGDREAVLPPIEPKA